MILTKSHLLNRHREIRLIKRDIRPHMPNLRSILPIRIRWVDPTQPVVRRRVERAPEPKVALHLEAAVINADGNVEELADYG